MKLLAPVFAALATASADQLTCEELCAHGSLNAIDGTVRSETKDFCHSVRASVLVGLGETTETTHRSLD